MLLEYVRLVVILIICNMVLSTERPDRARLLSKFTGLLEELDLDFSNENHPFKETLHPNYHTNLMNEKTGEILLLHDHRGNIHNSTFHYLALKAHEIYEIPNTFIADKAIRQSDTGGLSNEGFLYLAHRNLMRHSLGVFSLELYMTLLYRSRQEALNSISNHYSGNTRRDIILRQIAKNNFDEQFSALLLRLRLLMSEQMVYSEKCYYWNKVSGAEMDLSGVSKEIRYLGVIHEQQRELCENLPEFYELIKAKRKFFIQHELKDQMEEDDEKKEMMKILGDITSDGSSSDDSKDAQR